MKHFYDLRTVDDLADGEIATPGPGITYNLRSIDNRQLDVGTVVDVIRKGQRTLCENDHWQVDCRDWNRGCGPGPARLVTSLSTGSFFPLLPHVYTVWAFSRECEQLAGIEHDATHRNVVQLQCSPMFWRFFRNMLACRLAVFLKLVLTDGAASLNCAFLF